MEKEETRPRLLTNRTSLKVFFIPFIQLWRLLQRGYWTTAYWLKYQIRIKEFVVIDFRVLFFLGLMVYTAYLFWYSGPLYLAIPSLGTELYIIENTLRTVSIFVGIVFSFIVLSFNVFYKYFGRLTFIKFFTSKQIKYIFTLFICDMALLLYTCGYLKEGSTRNSYGDSLFIISLLVSIVLVLSIIPTLILLLRSSQNRNNIKELIADFNEDWSLSYHVNVLWERGDKNSHHQRDPITLLTEIGTAAIKDYDRTSFVAIKEGCLEHLKKMHQDYKKDGKFHPNAFYVSLDELLRPLFNVAIKERNETAALMIVDMYHEVEEFYVKNFEDFNVYKSTEHHYDGIRFTVVMSQFMTKSLQFNEDTVSGRIIDVLREWWDETIIKIYLPEIQYEYPKGQRFPTDKTSFFLSSTYHQLAIIFELIYTYKKIFLYKEISRFHSVTNLSILSSKNARDTKVYLLQINGINAQGQFEKFLPKLDLDIASEIYPFDSLAIDQEMDNIRSLVPFQYQMRVVDVLFRHNKLNAYVINNIKAVAFHALHRFTEHSIYKKALKAIIEKFDYLRSLINQPTTDYHKEIYILLERYLSSINEWMPEYKVKDREIEQLVADTLEKFSLKGQFSAELEAKGYIIRDVR